MKRKPLLLALVLILALVLTACGCNHTWNEASCETAKTCTQCGKTEGDALGHGWQDASCGAPKTCTVCGLTEGAALEHSWVDASCSAPKTCTLCGLTEGTSLDHNWELSTNCYNCGIGMCEVLGHRNSSWTASEETMTRSCDVCGFEESAALDYELLLKDNLQGSWHPVLLSNGSVYIPAGQLENYLVLTQVDEEGNIRLEVGSNTAMEGTISFQETETIDGIANIYFLADFGGDQLVKMGMYNDGDDYIVFAVDGIAVICAKMEQYVEHFQGSYASQDGSLTMKLNADGTFTANLEGEISGIWQPRPYFDRYGYQRASVILSYQVDGEKKAMTLGAFMGVTAEEAEDRLNHPEWKIQFEYYGENGGGLLNYVG